MLSRKRVIPLTIASVVLACILVGSLVWFNSKLGEPTTIYALPKSRENRANVTPALNSGQHQSAAVERSVEFTDDTLLTPGTSAKLNTGEERLMTDAEPEKVGLETEIAKSETNKQDESDNSAATHEARIASIQPDFERALEEGASLLEEGYDVSADHLRPKSIAERQSYLETLHSELESETDSDDAEYLEIAMNAFVQAMNERGVYFE